MPDVPTIAEAVPGLSCDGWYGIVGHTGMPAPIVAKLNAEMRQALANAAFAKQLEAVGIELGGGSPKEFSDFARMEITRWTKAARDAGLYTGAK